MGALHSLPAQLVAKERVLKLLQLADDVYQAWTGEKFEDGDNRDREPIVGIAKVTEHQLQWVVWHDTIVHILK